MRKSLTLILAGMITVAQAASDPYDVFRKFHPIERVTLREGMPLVAADSKGHMKSIHRSHMWVRTFKFQRLSPSLLATLRKMAARDKGVTYDVPGKALSVRLANGQQGYFDYKLRTLSFEGVAAPKKK